MSAYTGTPTLAYQQQSILTATPGQLVVMLYDGCLRFLHQAATGMRDGNARAATMKLRRGEAIVSELLVTLDLEQGGDVAERLQSIYLFCRRALRQAASEQDPALVDQVSTLLSELRDAWAEIA